MNLLEVFVQLHVTGIASLRSEAILVLFLSHTISHRPLMISGLQLMHTYTRLDPITDTLSNNSIGNNSMI